MSPFVLDSKTHNNNRNGYLIYITPKNANCISNQTLITINEYYNDFIARNYFKKQIVNLESEPTRFKIINYDTQETAKFLNNHKILTNPFYLYTKDLHVIYN